LAVYFIGSSATDKSNAAAVIDSVVVESVDE